MAHRQAYIAETKNYKPVSVNFQDRLQTLVTQLMNERNQLKEELHAKNAKLAEIERINVELVTETKVLEEKYRAAKENCTTTDFFAKGVLAIAKKLAHDEASVGSNQAELLDTLPASTSNSATPLQVAPNDEAANNNQMAPDNMEVANEEVVQIDGDDDGNQQDDQPAAPGGTSFASDAPSLSIVLDL